MRRFTSPSSRGLSRCMFLVLALGCSLKAEPVFKLGPAPAVPPPPLGAIAPPEAGAVPGTPLPQNSPFRWGGVVFRPHVSYALMHGEGIQAQPGKPLATTIHAYAAGFNLDLGSRWGIAGTAMRSLYSNPAFRNTFDHAISVTNGTTYRDWTLRFFHGYASTSVPLVETGRQTPQEAHSTTANVAYALNTRVLIDLTLEQQLQFPEEFSTSREWPARLWLHYQMSPRLDLALGGAGGYVVVTPGPNMTYERPQVQLTWRPRDSIAVQISAGREHRTFSTAQSVTLDRGVFGSSLQYRPTKTTTLTGSVDRDLAVSYFSGQVSENTRRAIRLQQRLLKHFQLVAGLESHRVAYVGVTPVQPQGHDARDDIRRAVNFRLATTFRSRGSIAVSFQRQKNVSNVQAFAFTSNQYSFELGYRY